MKKQITLLLLFSSLIGYLEWGGGNSGFLYELEIDIIQKMWSAPLEVLHPFTVLPLIGQLLLLTSLFLKKPNKALFITGLVCLSTIMLMLLVIGLLSMNWKIIVCSLPFLIVAVVAVVDMRRTAKVL